MVTDLLLEKIGPHASWDALWDKLQHYLSQLRYDISKNNAHCIDITTDC